MEVSELKPFQLVKLREWSAQCRDCCEWFVVEQTRFHFVLIPQFEEIVAERKYSPLQPRQYTQLMIVKAGMELEAWKYIFSLEEIKGEVVMKLYEIFLLHGGLKKLLSDLFTRK